jgi:chemotaxis family two-component system response regulator Rcp1
MCKSVNGFGGQIWSRSEPGNNANVLLRDNGSRDAMKLRILYAEDNNLDMHLVREALSQQGLDFDLTVATDGEKALIFLKHIENDVSRPDVVLLDLNLPRVTGHELLQTVRQNKLTSKIPVVILSSSDSSNDRERAARSGANLYFVKPCDFDGFTQLALAVKRIASELELAF